MDEVRTSPTTKLYVKHRRISTQKQPNVCASGSASDRTRRRGGEGAGGLVVGKEEGVTQATPFISQCTRNIWCKDEACDLPNRCYQLGARKRDGISYHETDSFDAWVFRPPLPIELNATLLTKKITMNLCNAENRAAAALFQAGLTGDPNWDPSFGVLIDQWLYLYYY